MAAVPYPQQKKYTQKNRRRNWDKSCDQCADEWKTAKSNYLRRDGLCNGCAAYMRRWKRDYSLTQLVKRRKQLAKWDGRLVAVSGGRGKVVSIKRQATKRRRSA